MNTYFPTIYELSRKTVRELHEMFRSAASVAASAQCPGEERQTARQTLQNIRRCLAAKSLRL